MGPILGDYIGTIIGSIPPFPTKHQGEDMLFLLAPALASEGVLHGLRGEFRRARGGTQRLQYPLIKEYSFNHIRDPTTI